MSIETILLLLLIVVVIGVFYDSSWGYAPISILAALLIILLVWTLYTGKTPRGATEDIKDRLQETGGELKEMGHEAAESIKDVVKPVESAH